MVYQGDPYAGAGFPQQNPYASFIPATGEHPGEVINMPTNPYWQMKIIEERLDEERARQVKAELDAEVAKRDRLWPDDYLYDEEG